AAAWRKAGRRGGSARRAWQGRLKASSQADDFRRGLAGGLPASAFAALDKGLEEVLAEPPVNATRVHSGAALATLTPAIPEMIGGSADLTGLHDTLLKRMCALA